MKDWIKQIILVLARLLFKSGAKILISVADKDSDGKLSQEEMEALLGEQLENILN